MGGGFGIIYVDNKFLYQLNSMKNIKVTIITGNNINY